MNLKILYWIEAIISLFLYFYYKQINDSLLYSIFAILIVLGGIILYYQIRDYGLYKVNWKKNLDILIKTGYYKTFFTIACIFSIIMVITSLYELNKGGDFFKPLFVMGLIGIIIFGYFIFLMKKLENKDGRY
jgi:hypothetical protein